MLSRNAYSCDSLRCSFVSAGDVVGSGPGNLEVSHGTLVALIAAGSGFPEHNGMAPGVDILDAGLAAMFLGVEDATMSTAFAWLLRSDADVANLSFGFGRCSDISFNSTRLLIPGEAVDRGMVVVVSAGNEGLWNGNAPWYESINEWGCGHNVITVGGIDNSDQDNIRIYDISGKGPATHHVNGTTYPVLKPEIVAPAMMQVPQYTTGNTTATIYGTSFSTPAVSAVAALVLSERDMEPAAVKASVLLGADWTGPVPCTSVQYETNNATDNCSHARQPSNLAEATGDGSLEIINNVGFGILNASKTLNYVSQAYGSHLVEDNLDSDTDIDGYAFEITDAEEPVKIILSWTVDPFYDNYYAPQGENYFADLGFTVDCPGMETISAQSAYQANEFAVFVPAETGTCTITVMGSDIDTPRRSQQDYALASTLPLYAIDIERPDPTISSNKQSPTNAHSITFTADFGEQVDAATFTPSDVSASSGTVSDPLPAGGTAGTFTFEVSGLAAGNLTVSIPEGGVLDLAGHNNTASDPYVVEIERTRPVPVLSTAAFSPVNASGITFTVDFGVPVDAATFTPSDVSASAGTVSDPLPAGGTAGTFTFEVSGLAAGNLTVSIPEGGVLDLAGHNNTASDPYVVEIERTRPVPVLSTAAFSPVNASGITLTVDFGEQVDAATFTPSDVSASAGTVSDPLPAGGTAGTFTFEVSGLAAGNLTVSIPEGGVLDLAGNNNTASDQITLAVTSIPAGTTPDAAFVTTWQTTSANESILIPVGDARGTYTVTWGDASIDTDVSGHQMHTYETAGTYTVSIYGDFPQIYLPYYPENSSKLQSIEQWGDIRWESMRGAFSGASNMVYRATDAPNLSAVTDTSEMFRFASSFNGNLSTWDVSSVTDASQMFAYARSFNGDMSSWNVSGMIDMSKMLKGTHSAIRNLGDWYVVLDDTIMSEANETLVISAQNAYLDGQNPTYVVNDARFAVANGALAVKPGRSAPPGTYNVTVTVGGVIGEHRDTLHSRTIQVTVEGDAAPPTILSAAYLTGNGTLTVTFSEPLNGTIHYDHLHVRDAGQSSGGISLDEAQVKQSSGSAVTVLLAAQQRADFARMAAPQLDVGQGAVSDITGNEVAVVVDQPVDAVAAVAGSGAFVTTWTVGAGDSVTIPVGGSAATYDIDWGDGTVETGVVGDRTHTYDAGGNYTVLISDDFERIYLNGHQVASKLASIDQWGDVQWTSMESAFTGASNMVYGATDTPDLSAVTDTSEMLKSATSFNGDISDWDVSEVTNMDGMFFKARSFNGDISGWDVSEVTNMGAMFHKATSFNGDISAWDVSEVTNMGDMFHEATSFNSNISGWDVSNVADMTGMFVNAASFNGDISGWDVSSVTEMEAMFVNAASFDQDLSSWNVSKVTNMGDMFFKAVSFNGDISAWDVSKVTNMGDMFFKAVSFNQNLGAWYVVLDGDTLSGSADSIGISAQNQVLDDQNPTYTIDGAAPNGDKFWIVNGSHLAVRTDQAVAQGQYNVTIKSTGSFGVGNFRVAEITVSEDVVLQTNNPPSVEAGHDQTVGEDTAVTLAGSATDLDGDALTYLWTHDPASLDIALANATSPSTTFTAPLVNATTTVTFTLTADDGTVASSDSVSVTITHNNLPSVEAGHDQTAGEGTTVTLAGSATDPDGDALTYLWTHDPASLDIALANATSPSTTFTAPLVNATTTVTFTLTADDSTAAHSDAVTVTILDVPANDTQTVISEQTSSVVLEPEEPRGTRDIGRMILNSTLPGTIDAGWEAPAEAPADYRISWAKAGESFRTWTDLSGNAFPPMHSRGHFNPIT